MKNYEKYVLTRLQNHTCFTPTCEEDKGFLLNNCQKMLEQLDIPLNYKEISAVQYNFYDRTINECDINMSNVVRDDNHAILETNNIETIIYHLEKQDRYSEYFIEKLTDLNFDYVAHKLNSDKTSADELWKIFYAVNDPRFIVKQVATASNVLTDNCFTSNLYWNNKVINSRDFCD